MEPGNQTHGSKLFLLGFTENPEQEMSLFGLFFDLYMVGLVRNFLIMLAIACDSHLPTPMYFFLSNLSFVALCLVSTTVPKMLENIMMRNKAISYSGCNSQMYFFMVFAVMDNLLPSVIAYDCFVAICHPLHYLSIIAPNACGLLILLSWTISLLNALLHTLMTMRLSFCKNQDIPHFFCDLSQVLKLSCSDTFINNILIYSGTSLLVIVPLTGILFSYTQICSSILKVPSRGGKHKAFSICESHLCAVSLFYGTVFGVYLSFSTARSSWKNSVTSVMYTVITPMLNPFIYSLRNKDIKDALWRIIRKPTSSQ